MAEDNYQYTRAKEFKYALEINGLISATISEVNIGKRTISVTEHAGTGQNYAVPEPGGMKFAKMVLKMVVPDSGPGGLYFTQWLDQCQDALSGNGSPIASCMRIISLYQRDNAGQNFRTTTFYNAFACDESSANLVSMAFDKDAIDEVEIAYAYRIRQ